MTYFQMYLNQVELIISKINAIKTISRFIIGKEINFKDMVLQGERKEASLTSCGRRIDGSGHLGLCKERVEVGIVGETGGLGFNRIIQLIKLKV